MTEILKKFWVATDKVAIRHNAVCDVQTSARHDEGNPRRERIGRSDGSNHVDLRAAQAPISVITTGYSLPERLHPSDNSSDPMQA